MFGNNSFNNLTEEQKINLLKQLVKMAKADGVFKFVELKYLTEVAEMMGITANQLDEIIKDDTLTALPSTKLEKARQVYRLAVMMEIDQQTTFSEKKLLKDLAILLNLHPSGVDQMLEAMKENKGAMLLNEQLEDIFSKELNSNLNNMTIEEKIALIKQLYKMSKADQKLDLKEKKFLYEFALSLNLPLEIIEDILGDNEISFNSSVPEKIEDRIIQIYRLILMMKIDNEISDSEINTLKNIALELGLHPDAVMTLLERLKKTATIEFDELQEIFNVSKN